MAAIDWSEEIAILQEKTPKHWEIHFDLFLIEETRKIFGKSVIPSNATEEQISELKQNVHQRCVDLVIIVPKRKEKKNEEADNTNPE